MDDNKMKVSKYDRQIRLWGSRGQQRLAQAKVALIGCTGAGIETLKNLVLPGIGTIDIWDDRILTVEDLSSSFFYEHECVGEQRGAVAQRNLLEMNPDVKGTFHQKGLSQFLEDNSIVQSYTLVIFGQSLNEKQIIEASQKLWQLKVPAIFISVCGFFYYIRSQKQIHFVQSSNTNAKKYYLRVSDPFPQLLQHANAHDVYKWLQKIEDKDVETVRQEINVMSNIPYVLILIKVVQNLPQDKRTRKFIQQQLNRIKSKVEFRKRDNIEQAIKMVFDAQQTPQNFMVDIGLLQNKYVKQCKSDSHLMIKFLNVVGKFLSKTGKLPQPTTLPDMHSTTQNFINLKSIYKQKHQQDVQQITKMIKQQFNDNNNTQINQSALSDYINNLSYLQVVQMRSYAQQLKSPILQNIKHSYLPNQQDLILSIRTHQKSKQLANYPQISQQQIQQISQNIKMQLKIQQNDERFIRQVCRSKGRSDINIYSMAGALAGQQAIKLITGCFTPMNSGYIFNGVLGTGFQVKL